MKNYRKFIIPLLKMTFCIAMKLQNSEKRGKIVQIPQYFKAALQKKVPQTKFKQKWQMGKKYMMYVQREGNI